MIRKKKTKIEETKIKTKSKTKMSKILEKTLQMGLVYDNPVEAMRTYDQLSKSIDEEEIERE